MIFSLQYQHQQHFESFHKNSYILNMNTSVASTNVKLFAILTFTWLSLDLSLTLTFTWTPTKLHITVTWPSSDLPLTFKRSLMVAPSDFYKLHKK